jgi:hypothetical protein
MQMYITQKRGYFQRMYYSGFLILVSSLGCSVNHMVKRHICVSYVSICQLTHLDTLNDLVLFHLHSDAVQICHNWDKKENPALRHITLTEMLPDM